MPPDSIVTHAVNAYVKSLSFPGQRYLVSVQTDSSLPERAYGGLQSIGVIKLIPGTPPELQAGALREATASSTRSLFVLYHGASPVGTDTTDVKFSAHYVGAGARSPAAAKTVRFTCDSTGGTWTVKDAASPGE